MFVPRITLHLMLKILQIWHLLSFLKHHVTTLVPVFNNPDKLTNDLVIFNFNLTCICGYVKKVDSVLWIWHSDPAQVFNNADYFKNNFHT